MSELLKYYQEYHKGGSSYVLADWKGCSRHLMLEGWLKTHLKPQGKVLDIGCGDGSYSKWASEFNWTGIDVNEETTGYNGTRLIGDIEKFPYALDEGSFDGVLCSEVLEHLWNPEGVHKEAYRVLKKGGVYAISTPNFSWIEHMISGWSQVLYNPTGATHTKEHIRFYDVDTHVRMLTAAGFKVLDFMGADLQFGPFFQEARWILKESLPNKSDGEIDLILGKMFRTTCHTIGVLSVKP